MVMSFRTRTIIYYAIVILILVMAVPTVMMGIRWIENRFFQEIRVTATVVSVTPITTNNGSLYYWLKIEYPPEHILVSNNTFPEVTQTKPGDRIAVSFYNKDKLPVRPYEFDNLDLDLANQTAKPPPKPPKHSNEPRGKAIVPRPRSETEPDLDTPP